jgi:Tol biopolymer transport system component
MPPGRRRATRSRSSAVPAPATVTTIRGRAPCSWSPVTAPGLTCLSTTDVHAYSPAWSADGTKLAFGGDPVDGSGGGLYVATSADADVRNVLTVPYWIGIPAWSPDGQHIAYLGTLAGERCTKAPGRADVWITGADGGTSQPLTTRARADAEGLRLTWQPRSP